MGIRKLVFHHHHTKFYTPRARATSAAGPKGHPRAGGVPQCRALICRKNILIFYYHYVNDDFIL